MDYGALTQGRVELDADGKRFGYVNEIIGKLVGADQLRTAVKRPWLPILKMEVSMNARLEELSKTQQTNDNPPI